MTPEWLDRSDHGDRPVQAHPRRVPRPRPFTFSFRNSKLNAPICKTFSRPWTKSLVNMHRSVFVRMATALFWFWEAQHVSAATAVCNARVYGNPIASDCQAALSKIPFANDRSSDKTLPRLFVEPQYAGPFGFVNNKYRPARIVPLPRIWKHSTSEIGYIRHALPKFISLRADSCRVAFMTLGLPRQPGVYRPAFGGSWKQINVQAAGLRDCAAPGNSQGGYVIYNCEGPRPYPSRVTKFGILISDLVLVWSGSTAATLYLYSSDSRFTNIVNRYMSDGIPIHPIAPTELSNTSSTGLLNASEANAAYGLEDLVAITTEIGSLESGQVHLWD